MTAVCPCCGLTHPVATFAAALGITPAEAKILCALYDSSADALVSYNAMAAVLGYQDGAAQTRTVYQHVYRLRKKFGMAAIVWVKDDGAKLAPFFRDQCERLLHDSGPIDRSGNPRPA